MIIEISTECQRQLNELQSILNKNQKPLLSYSQVIKVLIKNFHNSIFANGKIIEMSKVSKN